MPGVYPEAVRMLNDAVQRHAAGNKSEFARMIGRSPSAINQACSGSTSLTRETVERIAGLPGEDREAWLNAAGLGDTSPENERALTARLTAEAVVRRLLETYHLEPLSEEFLRRLNQLQDKHGIAPRMPYLRGGLDALTRETMEGYLADLDQMMAREAEEIRQRSKGEGTPPPPT
jgi:plasmid maintenance system antidote protein VapI